MLELGISTLLFLSSGLCNYTFAEYNLSDLIHLWQQETCFYFAPVKQTLDVGLSPLQSLPALSDHVIYKTSRVMISNTMHQKQGWLILTTKNTIQLEFQIQVSFIFHCKNKKQNLGIITITFSSFSQQGRLSTREAIRLQNMH